jgi:hypothetical protein
MIRHFVLPRVFLGLIHYDDRSHPRLANPFCVTDGEIPTLFHLGKSGREVAE